MDADIASISGMAGGTAPRCVGAPDGSQRAVDQEGDDELHSLGRCLRQSKTLRLGLMLKSWQRMPYSCHTRVIDMTMHSRIR